MKFRISPECTLETDVDTLTDAIFYQLPLCYFCGDKSDARRIASAILDALTDMDMLATDDQYNAAALGAMEEDAGDWHDQRARREAYDDTPIDPDNVPF